VLGHAPRELSNGQKQRTALARALIGNPDVLLLDDPLRNVDAKLRYEMRLELPNLLRRGTAAVLYVTQDYREAMAIADRIAVLVGGRLEQVASPEEIYVAPASVAVARLFGDPSINLAEVTPFVEHGTLFAMVSGAKVRLGSANEYVDYAASKGALDTFTLGLSRELASEGIRVNAVRPGFIHTEFHALSGDPDRVSKLEPGIPMGRGGRAEEVAEGIIWLLSDKASYTTGTFLDLAGGR